MPSIGYVAVGSNNLPAAKAYYDALLASIGAAPLMEHPSGGRVYGLDGKLFFGVLGPYDGKPATMGNGCMASFCLDSTADVDAFHAMALELGGTDEGAPGWRGPGYYFSYFRDLDGNKLCAYFVG